MFFTSKKGKWYNWAAQAKPVYRYTVTLSVILLCVCSWRFGIYAYMEDHITTNRAAIAQMNQQLCMLNRAQRVCNEISCRVPQLKNKLACYTTSYCTPGFCQSQVDRVIDKAQKVNLKLTSYDKGQASDEQWYSCDNVHFSFSGTLANISQLFASLKQENALVQCKSFSCQHTHDDVYNASCKLAFISVPSA